MNLFNMTDMARSAQLSDCGKYRYLLTRCWRPEAKQLGFIMLNPSTANALDDDPTIRRCMGFARAWDFGGIVVGNLFNLRATDPTELWPSGTPGADCITSNLRGADWLAHITGPDRLRFIVPVFSCPLVIAAWGSHEVIQRTQMHISARGFAQSAKRDLHCLAVNADGQPRHPLYVRKDAKPIVWFDSSATEGTA